MLQDQDGERLVLTLRWNRDDHPRAPLRLVAWLDPLATEIIEQPALGALLLAAGYARQLPVSRSGPG